MIPRRVALAGAGTMGRGIAQWFAQVGSEVFLWDISCAAAEQACQRIQVSWEKSRAKGRFSRSQTDAFQKRLHPGPFEDVPTDCHLAIEAIVEDCKAKVDLLSRLDRHMGPDCVLASNTSSIPIDRMAASLPQERRGRFVGLHFFNPAAVMKLVEIVAGHFTDKELCRSLEEWFAAQGKRPVVCRDAPGFIANRVVRGFYGEALRIAAGDSRQSFREIDQVMRQAAGMPMGPFELMDLIGVEVNHTVTTSLWESFYRDPRFAPHPLQRAVIARGGKFYP